MKHVISLQPLEYQLLLAPRGNITIDCTPMQPAIDTISHYCEQVELLKSRPKPEAANELRITLLEDTCTRLTISPTNMQHLAGANWTLSML